MSQESGSKTEVSSDHILQHPVPDFLQKGRNNPINGTTCFFTESTFRKVVGPEISFRDKFMMQVARAKETRQKTEEKKKRRKDLDLPEENRSDSKVSKSSCVDVVSEGQETFTEAANNVDSTDDDDSLTDLVIADDEAPVKENTSETVQDTEVITSRENYETERNETVPIVDTANLHQNQFVTEPLKHDDEAIPLYATGIISQRNNALALEEKRNEESPVTPFASNKSGNTHESEPCIIQESRPVTKEDVRLVIPSATSGCDSRASINTTEPVQSTESFLPLIPALMSEPTGAYKSQNAADLNKPGATSLFYTSDQTPASPSPQDSKPGAQNSSLDTGPSVPSTAELEHHEEESDVPIFSLAATSDAAGRGAGVKRSQRNKGIWSSGQEEDLQNPPQQRLKSKDNTAKDALKFIQSSLTRNQMATYLQLFEKYARPYLHGGQHPMFTETQKREMSDFETLKERVLNEQREFQSYLQQNAIRNPHFYTFIPGYAKHYAYSKLQSYRPSKRLLTKFCNKFASEISLQVRSESERADFIFKRQLLEMGSPPRVALPDVLLERNPVQIPHNMSKIEQYFPSSGANQDIDILHHESVSEDVNAEALAVKFGCEAVLSSSVIKCLLDNRAPDFKRAWNIPVTVKEHQTKDGVQKTVYLDKPVFEDDLLVRDYNALFHKYALRTMVSQPKHGPTYRSVRPQRQPGNKGQVKPGVNTVDDPFDIFATDLEALETFGKTSVAPANPTDVTSAETNCRSNSIAEAHSEKECTEGNDRISQTSLEMQTQEVDSPGSNNTNLDKKQVSLGKRCLKSPTQKESNNVNWQETLSSPPKKLRDEAALPDTSVTDKSQSSCLNTEESPSKSTRSKTRLLSLSPLASSTRKNAQTERRCFTGCVDAHVGSSNPLDLILGPNVTTMDKKTNVSGSQENPSLYTPHSETLSSLVYSQWELGHTNILVRTRSQGTFKTKNVYLTAKLEYQSTHGLEQVTAEEMVRDWAACYIRPNSKLVRARINAFTSNIIMFEELECHQILRPSSSFRPEERFAFIRNLLTHLLSLDKGKYLVSHEPGKSFCGIRTLQQGARFNKMEKPVRIPSETKLSQGPVPWIPIDPTILLPYHTLHQRIPATFLPKDVKIVPGSKKPPQAKVVASLANKKKKKKKNKFQKKDEREFF
ncbi:NMDA receptor regulated 2 [Elysia marginata]|uniref:NMDA receptor regulated 2 n=1 Tax=Elysia marginata TaxID=1093978 RepID=A0AAV4INF7_9GAST|nr:NMDA receptor regulated 2 [Elysia marginata]